MVKQRSIHICFAFNFACVFAHMKSVVRGYQIIWLVCSVQCASASFDCTFPMSRWAQLLDCLLLLKSINHLIIIVLFPSISVQGVRVFRFSLAPYTRIELIQNNKRSALYQDQSEWKKNDRNRKVEKERKTSGWNYGHFVSVKTIKKTVQSECAV